MSDNEHDDDYQDMDGGKPKYANSKERTKAKYGDEASQHTLKGDEKFADGMNKKQRRCQDIICLIVFVLYVGAMGFASVYGFIHGEVNKLLSPIDGNNMFCGQKNGDTANGDLTDYPYLYIGNLKDAVADVAASSVVGGLSGMDEAFTTAVCVKHCPEKRVDGKSVVECKPDTQLCTNNRGQYISTNIAGFCLPSHGAESFPSGSELRTHYNDIKDALKHTVGGKTIANIMKAMTSIYVSIGTGFVYSLILLYLMSAYAEAISYICIVLTGLGLFGGSILCWFIRADVIEERGAPGSGTAIQGDDLADSETEAFWLLVGCIALACVGCCYCVCVVCGWKHLRQAIDVIDGAADFAVGNKRVIAVPVLYIILNLISFMVWLYSFACVVALNKITADGDSYPQARTVHWTAATKAMGLAMVFGILWIMAWWTYSGKFVIMAAATTYYFNSDAEHEGEAELLYSFKLAHIYHTGSIAAGAFIIAVIELIKIIFLYLAKKAEKASGGNKCIKAVVCVAECILSCIEKICDYINQAAFAYICVTGDGFCEGAWKGFLLNVKHMLDFSFANFIAKVFILLGKVTLVALNCFTLVFIMKDITAEATSSNSIWGPVGVCALISYIIAALFLGIFENAVMALMTCLCVDMDLHDGEPKYGPATFHENIEKVRKHNDDASEDGSRVADSDDEKGGKKNAMK